MKLFVLFWLSLVRVWAKKHRKHIAEYEPTNIVFNTYPTEGHVAAVGHYFADNGDGHLDLFVTKGSELRVWRWNKGIDQLKMTIIHLYICFCCFQIEKFTKELQQQLASMLQSTMSFQWILMAMAS